MGGEKLTKEVEKRTNIAETSIFVQLTDENFERKISPPNLNSSRDASGLRPTLSQGQLSYSKKSIAAFCLLLVEQTSQSPIGTLKHKNKVQKKRCNLHSCSPRTSNDEIFHSLRADATKTSTLIVTDTVPEYY